MSVLESSIEFIINGVFLEKVYETAMMLELIFGNKQ